MFLDYAGEFQTDQMTGCLEQFSVEFWEPKPKWSWQPIGAKVDIIASSWVLKLKTGKLCEARENTSDQTMIGLSFEPDGWEGGTRFLTNYRAKFKKTKAIMDSASFDAIENCFH